MADRRGQKAASSFLFKLAESLGMQGISFVVSVVLARLLDPSDYGVLTLLTVFIAVSQVFVQSGLNTALIQKKDVARWFRYKTRWWPGRWPFAG